MRDVFDGQPDFAGIRPQKSRQHVEHGRLSRSDRPDQAKYLARFVFERHFADGGDAAEVLGQGADSQQAHGRSFASWGAGCAIRACACKLVARTHSPVRNMRANTMTTAANTIIWMPPNSRSHSDARFTSSAPRI